MRCGQGTAPIQLKWPGFVNNGEGGENGWKWMGLTLADEDTGIHYVLILRMSVKLLKQRETPNRDYQVYGREKQSHGAGG